MPYFLRSHHISDGNSINQFTRHSIPNLLTICSLGLLIAQAGYEESLLTGIVEYSGGTCNRAMVKIKVQLPEKDCDAKAEFIENLQTHGFIKENISLGEFQGGNVCNYCFFYEKEGSKAC